MRSVLIRLAPRPPTHSGGFCGAVCSPSKRIAGAPHTEPALCMTQATYRGARLWNSVRCDGPCVGTLSASAFWQCVRVRRSADAIGGGWRPAFAFYTHVVFRTRLFEAEKLRRVGRCRDGNMTENPVFLEAKHGGGAV